MEIDNLYILGGNETKAQIKINKNSKVIFIDVEQEGYNKVSIIKNFQEKQNILREDWLNFQEQVFKKIKPKIDKDEDFYYVLYNLFFESSPNKTNSIYKFFKIKLIVEYIKSKKIKNVFLYNVPKDIEIFFHLNSSKLNIYIKTLKKKKRKFLSKKFFKNLLKKYFVLSIINRFAAEYKKKLEKFPLPKKIIKSYLAIIILVDNRLIKVFQTNILRMFLSC